MAFLPFELSVGMSFKDHLIMFHCFHKYFDEKFYGEVSCTNIILILLTRGLLMMMLYIKSIIITMKVC
jgi:hypothetical protein